MHSSGKSTFNYGSDTQIVKEDQESELLIEKLNKSSVDHVPVFLFIIFVDVSSRYQRSDAGCYVSSLDELTDVDI